MPSLDQPVASQAPEAQSQYFRSMDQLADTAEFRAFVEREFPSIAPEIIDGPTRRNILRLMGASIALAGLAGCRWPKETILPHARAVPNRIPGVPVQFATGFERAGVAQGLLATSFDGRPLRVDGNELHPTNGGESVSLKDKEGKPRRVAGCDAWTQATILDLYDPDRIQRVTQDGQVASFDAFDRALDGIRAAMAADGGAKVALLTEATASLTFLRAVRDLQAEFPNLRCYSHEPLVADRDASALKTMDGTPVRTDYDFTAADIVVDFGSDFITAHPNSLRYARDFMTRRRPSKANGFDSSRLYSFESNLSVTGSRADVRQAIRASQLPAALYQLASALAQRLDGLNLTIPARGNNQPIRPDRLTQLVDDLLEHRGSSVILAGPALSPAAQQLVEQLNRALGNVGKTLWHTRPADSTAMFEGLEQLTARLEAGVVDTLLVFGGNPVFDAPVDSDFATAFGKVKNRIHLSQLANETAAASNWIIPRAHYLESWDLLRAYDGTLTMCQPLISPLYNGRTPAEVLARLAGETLPNAFDLTQASFNAQQPTDAGMGMPTWDGALHAGVIDNTRYARLAVNDVPLSLSLSAPTDARDDAFDLLFAADYSLYDGRYANNSWLQETPDPLTKLTWDNAALINPADARRLGITRGDMLEITFDNRTLEIAAFVQPGVAKGTLVLPLGYGTRCGQVSLNTGFNTYTLRTRSAAYVAPNAAVQKTRGRYTLATTQDHHAMESWVGEDTTQARIPQLAREMPLAAYIERPDDAQHVIHLPVVPKTGKMVALFDDVQYTADNQWQMTVDLSACTGCNACLVACQAENNIPVVGKDEVHVGREMHWIRIDRYFKGDADEIEGVAVQPVTCHHCENAPCEQVCPVAATVHDEEGLNSMVYNRCIGTRYCSNNCPYKVRRFNWFYNHPGPKSPRHAQKNQLSKQQLAIADMQHNPEVTVRTRGVMEKCTFCTQRIKDVRIKVKNEMLRNGGDGIIHDGMVTPACAQACPTEAIIFGDRANPQHRVAKALDNPRSYDLLPELNAKPRLNYLARINNNPFEEYEFFGHGHGHGHGDKNGAQPHDNHGGNDDAGNGHGNHG